jgi:hypothetical protein
MSGGGFANGLALANSGANFNGTGTIQWGFNELTKSASANTKSAWFSMGTLTTDCLALLLRVGYLNNSGTDHGVLHDIGIGAAGSQVVVVSNIVQGQPAGTALTNFVLFQHVLPLSFPAGTQLWIRSSVDVASSTPHLGGSFTPMGSAFNQMQEFAGVETVGQVGTGTGATLIGGAGAKGSYVQLGTSTQDYAAMFLCFDFAAQSGTIRGLIDVAIGASGSQQIIIPNVSAGPGDGFSYMDLEPVPVQVPAGTKIWGRFSNLDGSTNSIGLTAYGVLG